MENVTGNPVEGDDFFGRGDELKQLRQAVESGNHVLLVGPRRVGKSSLVAELARLLTQAGWFVVKVDVQHSADEAAFLHEIQEAVRCTGIQLPLLAKVTDVVQRFRRAVRGAKVSVVGTSVELAETPADWEDAAASLKTLITTLPADGRRVLITVDELPIFLNKLLETDGGAARVRGILDWLRSVRQACGTRLPWILCGSIRLDSFVEQHGLEGCINELLPQPLEAFEVPQAMELLKRLGAKPEQACPLSDDVARLMVERVGWPIPYYLQLLFHGLKSLPKPRRSADFPGAEDVAAAYETLLGPHHRMHFGHWDSRLGDLLDAGGQTKARLLLNHLCEYPAGRTRDQLRVVLAAVYPQADPARLDRELRDLLDFLERDGYLGRHGEQYAFRSFLLRDYWQRRFGA